MTKYVTEILRQLGINYEEYRIENHRNEESGETWITLHPQSEWRNEANLINRLDKLSQCAFGEYKIYWDEKSCYLNIVGLLEINSKGMQIYPLPTNEKPAKFTTEFILKTWEENREHLSELTQQNISE